MQGVERQLSLLHLNPGPGGTKMGTPHKNSVPAGAQEGEEVRTLFVSGLPMDVRLRELYLLFRGYEGYEGSFLKLISSKPGKPPQPIAFVSFKSRLQAERALDELQGVRFDPASSQTLRLEFARTNSRVSPRQPPTATTSQGVVTATQPLSLHKGGTSPSSYGSYIPVMTSHHQPLSHHVYAPTDTWPQRIPVQMAYQSLSQLSSPSPTLSPASSFPQLSVLNMLDSDNSQYPVQSPMYYTLVPSPSPTPTPVSAAQPHPPSGLSSVSTSSSLSSPSSACSTLFVANLELHHTEEEVADMFRNCAGFVRAKLFTRGGPPVAFVEFKNIECAASAMEKFQGCVLPNTKRVTGVRIEYARQRMGELRSPTTAAIVTDTAPSTAPTSMTSPSPIQNIYSGQYYHHQQQQQQRGVFSASNDHLSSNSSSCSSSTSELQQLPPQMWTLHNSSPVPMPYGNGFGPQPQMLVNGFPNQYVTPWPIKFN